MKDARGRAKAERNYQARYDAQQCRHCGRWSGKLRKGGICPRCDVLRTTAPLEQKEMAGTR